MNNQDQQAREAGRRMVARIAARQAAEQAEHDHEQARVISYQARIARQASRS